MLMTLIFIMNNQTTSTALALLSEGENPVFKNCIAWSRTNLALSFSTCFGDSFGIVLTRTTHQHMTRSPMMLWLCSTNQWGTWNISWQSTTGPNLLVRLGLRRAGERVTIQNLLQMIIVLLHTEVQWSVFDRGAASQEFQSSERDSRPRTLRRSLLW